MAVKETVWMVTILLFRSGGIFLGITGVLGTLRYSPYYSSWFFVRAAILLAISLLPFRWTGTNPAFAAVTALVVLTSYIATGLPFLNPIHHAFARAMFLAELVIIFVLLLEILRISLRTRSERQP
jgi:hypothetical protein